MLAVSGSTLSRQATVESIRHDGAQISALLPCWNCNTILLRATVVDNRGSRPENPGSNNFGREIEMLELKQLQQWLSDGRITRREFVARASVLGLTAGLSTTFLGDQAFAGTPKKGGRLRMGITDAATSDSLDPATLTTIHASLLTWGELRNNLVEIDHDGNPIPELAESWESTPNAATWTFKLRQGVEFHNGKTMDAEDVIYSINHHRGEESQSGAKGIVDPITEIKADGKHTVVISLAGGNADFPFILSDYHMQIVPDGTTDFEKGVGTGGYVMQSYDPGVLSLTERNPNYWKDGRGHFDEVETLAISDVAARTNALRTNEVDVINRCDRKTVDRLGQVPRYRCYSDHRDGALHHTDADRRTAVRRHQCPAGTQVRYRPRGAAQQHSAWHRRGRQRPSDQPGQPLPRRGTRTAAIRPRQGQIPSQESRAERGSRSSSMLPRPPSRAQSMPGCSTESTPPRRESISRWYGNPRTVIGAMSG